MSVIDLTWDTIESHFGNEWAAMIDGFSSNYWLRIDRSVGQPIVNDPLRKNHHFNSLQEAKDWCEKDFIARVLNVNTSLDWQVKESTIPIIKADVSGFNCNYVVFFDADEATWKVNQLNRRISRHQSLEDAKKWCESNYKIMLDTLLVQKPDPAFSTEEINLFNY